MLRVSTHKVNVRLGARWGLLKAAIIQNTPHQYKDEDLDEDEDAYLLAEGPLQQSVTLPPHHHEEEGEVGPSARPVSVQVEPQTHLVAVLAGVERCERKERKKG